MSYRDEKCPKSRYKDDRHSWRWLLTDNDFLDPRYVSIATCADCGVVVVSDCVSGVGETEKARWFRE